MEEHICKRENIISELKTKMDILYMDKEKIENNIEVLLQSKSLLEGKAIQSVVNSSIILSIFALGISIITLFVTMRK